MSYTPTFLEWYVMGQAVLAAQFHPYSSYGVLLLGTALITVAVHQRSRLSIWILGLRPGIRIAIFVFCLLETVPAFVAAFGVWALVAYEAGGRFGKWVFSFAGLLPGSPERIGHGIGALAGGLWGFIAGFVAAETLAGLVGAIAGYCLLRFKFWD
jgi:hypothetical protein